MADTKIVGGRGLPQSRGNGEGDDCCDCRADGVTIGGSGTKKHPFKVINQFPAEFASPDQSVIIFVRADGSDTRGDGKTPETAYRTLVHAVLDVPLNIGGGVTYTIDYTGIGQETLPDGYELPAWKAPLGYWYDDSDPYFPLRTAVSLRADYQPVAALGANGTITEADLTPTPIGGGIAYTDGFLDERNAGTGSGTDVITDEGDDIAKLTISGEEFDEGVTFITITGASNLANDGTFPVVGTDGESIYYENPAVVPEATFGGTYSAFVPYAYVETVADHGLWHVEFPIQDVTIAGVSSGAPDIGPAVNGTHTVLWRTKNSFIFEVDEPEINAKTPATNGTASVLFVQDATSGNAIIRADLKSFGANDTLVGKVLVSTFNEFWSAVIWRNTPTELFITQCFGPGSFGTPIMDMQIMEQSAELLTTCSFSAAGSRRGPHRGGLTIANCDSISLNGTKVTPLDDGIALCQVGGTLITAGCHLTRSRFNDAQGAAMSQCSYMDDMLWKGSAVDVERCYAINMPDPNLGGPVGWFYAYFGTVFHNVSINFDTTVESDFFAVKFHDQGPAGVFFQGRNTWNGVSGENILEGFFVGASVQASRNRMLNCEATFAVPNTPCVLAVNGGSFLVNSNSDPYGDAAFTAPGDFMALDGLPARTFEDFRQHALLPVGDITSGTGGTFDSVFEAIWPFTSSPLPSFGDPVYPSIESVSRPPDAGGVVVTYNPATGLVGISFEDGVSTNLDAETAIDAFAWSDGGGVRTKVPSPTPGALLVVIADEFPATLLDVGVNGPAGEYTNIRQNPKTGLLDCPGSLGTQSSVIAYTFPS